MYRDQTDSLSGNKNRNLDYLGFEIGKGTQENIDPKENQKIFLIDNSKEWATEEQNEDLSFYDYNSFSVDNFSQNSSILLFE